MSLFRKLRRSMGFGSDEDDNILFDDDPAATAGPESSQPEPLIPDPQPEAEPADVETIAADIMTGVVELFNSFQPEFIARCLDPEKQRQVLAEQMAPALKARIASLIHTEKERAAQEAADERRGLDDDLRRLRERNADLEKRRDELKEDKLSNSRQRRAFKERINDLESKNEKLNAEKEQLELEVRSMSNRLRAAEVIHPATEPEPESSPADIRISELTEKHRSETEALTARLNDAESRLKDAEERLKAAEKRAKEAEAKAAEAEKSRTGDCADAEAAARLAAEVAESRSTIQRLSDSIVRKDSRLSEMKGRLAKIDELNHKIEQLEEDNRALKKTINNNLFEHTTQMSELRREMEQNKPRRGRPRKKRPVPDDAEVEATIQKATPASSEAAPENKPAKPSIPRISAIDEHIEGSEWLVAPTPEELKTPVVASEPSDDFGYHAPSRAASRADDPNQLTLF